MSTLTLMTPKTGKLFLKVNHDKTGTGSVCDVEVLDHSSWLYKMTGSDVIHGVPSWHHQCVGSVEGTPLRVAGRTMTEGVSIIEAVERTDKTFAIGLQYHPEAAIVKRLDGAANASQFMSYDEALVYFKALVKQAKLQ